jgi:hypothetical protein
MSVYMFDSTPSHGDCVLTKASVTLLRVARPPDVAPRPCDATRLLGGDTSCHELMCIVVLSTFFANPSPKFLYGR